MKAEFLLKALGAQIEPYIGEVWAVEIEPRLVELMHEFKKELSEDIARHVAQIVAAQSEEVM
jgi:hypothetical protein|tara:strand:+ start:765 stop:950 length:186 start_codon:yes stop_codon:yes gene_type:complete